MMENNEEFVEDRHYKVRAGKVYTIKRKDAKYDGGTVANYSIAIPKKIGNADRYFYKKVRFKKDVEVKDGTKILLNVFFEDVLENKRDPFNPIWHIFVQDFEVVEEPEDTNTAILEYQNNLTNEEVEMKQNSDLITF